ncbi:hypothetical protein [Peribacillus simplex]|uniref:hypothetical protein n=1 Tax=Peribacillus simplex TaxID=1478 RepID=UPI003D2AFB92
MKLSVIFTNELPFMIQLPNDDYIVQVPISSSEEKEFKLNLSDKYFRLHISPFADSKKTKYIDGEKDELESYVVENNLSSYAFAPCKSYIRCTFEEELIFTQQLYDEVKDEDIIKNIKTTLIKKDNKNKTTTPEHELVSLAKEEFSNLTYEELKKFKEDYLIHKTLNKLGQLGYPYQVALNKFIKLYSDIRDDFFVETLTMHTLEGTYVQRFINDRFFDIYKLAGKMPSITPYEQWMPEIPATDLSTLKSRLVSGYDVPPTKDLILMAKNLCERGEYRSAIINGSAALEVAVEQKIIQKMSANGKTTTEIDAYLDDTKMKFKKRCNIQLNQQTGKSLVTDNSPLWNKVDAHRNNYRHKIAHSSLMPTASHTEQVIKDFEAAILWVEAL